MTVAWFFSVQKVLVVVTAIGLNLQVWILCSISEPAVKASALLKNEAAASAARFSSLWEEQQTLEPECCEGSQDKHTGNVRLVADTQLWQRAGNNCSHLSKIRSKGLEQLLGEVETKLGTLKIFGR